MNKLDISGLAQKFEAAHSKPRKPDSLPDAGEGMTTWEALQDVLQWARYKYPHPDRMRDQGRMLEAVRVMEASPNSTATPEEQELRRAATVAAAWVLSK
jgi:hypothetical protein